MNAWLQSTSSHAIMVYTVALICMLIAIFVGSWRHYCIFWEKNLRTNCPLGWRNSIFRFGSLIIVFCASVWVSFVGAGLVISQIYELHWWFLFLVLFLSRWLISKALGQGKAKKEYNAMHNKFLGRLKNDYR